MAEALDNVAVKPINEETGNMTVEQTNTQVSNEEANLKDFTAQGEFSVDNTRTTNQIS